MSVIKGGGPETKDTRDIGAEIISHLKSSIESETTREALIGAIGDSINEHSGKALHALSTISTREVTLCENVPVGTTSYHVRDAYSTSQTRQAIRKYMEKLPWVIHSTDITLKSGVASVVFEMGRKRT